MKRLFYITTLMLFVPYAVMEAGYVLMASLLPIREHIDNLTLPLLLYKVLGCPIGPYWYLHTLILCETVYYLVNSLLGIACFENMGKRLGNVMTVAVFVVLAFVIAGLEIGLSFVNSCYFIAGVLVRRFSKDFSSAFVARPFAILPVVVIACFPEWLDKSHPAGILMAYSVIGSLLFFYCYIVGGLRKVMLFVGRNTLYVLLFSPFFTILAKQYRAVLVCLDSSGMLFLVVSVTLAVSGSIFIARVFDKLGLSPYFFGKSMTVS